MRIVICRFMLLVLLGCIKGCNAESESVRVEDQVLPEPISYWVQIEDVSGGQIISPNQGYIWLNNEGKPVYLNGNGEMVSYQLGKFNPRSPEMLGKVHVGKLHSYQIRNMNQELKQDFAIEQDFEDIYHLRVFGAWAFAYDLMVYVENNEAKYITVCLDYCHEVQSQLITVSQR